jgi:HEAT repeat protein
VSARATRHALSPAEQARADAVAALAEDAGAEGAAVPVLIEALVDPSWAVRREVVAALARLGDAAVAPLCAVLREGRDDEARIAAAVDALAASTGSLVDAAAIELSASPVAPVAADAAQILGRRRSAAAVPTLAELTHAADDNVAVAAIEALGRIGGRAAVDALVAAAGSGNFFRTFPAIDVLGSSGDPRAVAPLQALLADPHYAHEAARALGRTGERGAAAPLTRLLATAGDRMVRVVATALAELHERHVERHGVAVALERALGSASSPAVVRRLTQALAGADPAEQAALCRVLGALGDDSAVPSLTRLLDAPPPVAIRAADALKQLGHGADEHVLAALRDGDSTRRALLLPLVTARASAAADLLDCLDDPDPAVRAAACDTLARTGNLAAVPRLFALLADPNPRIVHAAVGAIQSLGSDETEALTLAAAHAGDPQVRRAALRVVAYFGYASAIDVLVEAIAGSDERLRDAALHALPFLDDPRAMEALLGAARSESPRARAAAMRALGQCSSAPPVVADLERGLADADVWARYYACQSLGKLAWEPAAAAIAALLGDPAGQVRVAAVEALAHLKSEVAFTALREAAHAPEADLQRAALVGLGVGRRPAALPLLVEAAGSPEATTRLIAVSAIAGFDAPEVVPALGRAAVDADEGVRTAALGFLAARPTLAATETLIHLLGSGAPAERVLSALAIPSEERIAGVLSALQGAGDALATRLTSALARMRRPDAVAALDRALLLPNVAARRAAAVSLGALGTPVALQALRRASAGDPDPEVRRICALELSQ